MTFARETDPMVRRFERNQVLVCAVAAVSPAVAGRLDIALGVIGGGLLVAIGYGGIKAIVNVLTAAAIQGRQAKDARSSARRRLWGIVKFASSYALLALAAYVMLIRLHLHPLGVVLGASTPVVSAAVEAVTAMRRPARAEHQK